MNTSCRSIFVLGIFGLLALNTMSQDFEKSRNLEKTFPLKTGTEIRIINKYGNIHLMNWEKDSVKFEIEMQVSANKMHKVDKVFENIGFDFTATKYYIIAQTVFNNESSYFWREISDFANMLFKGGSQASINYTVYLPDVNSIDIQNKFGNVYTGNHTGDFRLTLSNGDFRANHIENASLLDLDFGKTTINSLENGRIDLGYGDLDIKTAGKLNVVSKSSTLLIEEINELDLDSRRDKIYISSLSKLNGKSSFSYINIKELQHEAIMNSSYGDLNIDKLNASFQLINFISEYTEIQLGIPEKAYYDVEINYNRKTYMVLPLSMEPLGRKQVGTDEEYVINGTIGEEESPASLLKISVVAGSLQIFEN
ncbi:MAG: hypothetical protein K9G58_02890 [Bacteroidales bacterium]|nr:hypothetical protein [Bacteroidales bacterium]MCF8386510.1 hypothetical protein [Bacteroidales bacterium]MCF8397086.1 hypothetical protein [Bacteroidales bacterium]